MWDRSLRLSVPWWSGIKAPKTATAVTSRKKTRGLQLYPLTARTLSKTNSIKGIYSKILDDKNSIVFDTEKPASCNMILDFQKTNLPTIANVFSPSERLYTRSPATTEGQGFTRPRSNFQNSCWLPAWQQPIHSLQITQLSDGFKYSSASSEQWDLIRSWNERRHRGVRYLCRSGASCRLQHSLYLLLPPTSFLKMSWTSPPW